MLVPFVILMAITKQPSATYVSMGVIIGAIAVAAGGLRVGIIISIVVSLLAPLAIISGLTPFTGAVLMAVMTLTVGRMSRYGLHRAAMLVPVFLAWPMLSPVPWVTSKELSTIGDLLKKKHLTLAQAVSVHHTSSSSSSSAAKHLVDQAMIALRMDQKYLAWVMAFFFIGGLLASVTMHFLLKKVSLPKPEPHTRAEAMPYTITITVLATATTFFFLDHPKDTGGAFMIATILVLAQVGYDIQWKPTVARVIGTLAGIGALAGVMAVVGGNSYVDVFGVPFPLNLYAIGLAFGFGAIVAKFSPHHWIYYVFITPATALLNAYTTSNVAQLGRARLADNLIGAALVTLAALITLGASKLSQRTGASSNLVAEPLPSLS